MTLNIKRCKVNDFQRDDNEQKKAATTGLRLFSYKGQILTSPPRSLRLERCHYYCSLRFLLQR